MNLDNIMIERAEKKIYRDGDSCIKVFNENYSKADVLNEALNQARVEESGLNIPRIKEVCMIDGKWAIVSEFIEGETLEQLMTENPEKKDDYLKLFVDIQIDVLSRRVPLLTKLRDKMNRKILQADLDETTKYELHTHLEGMPRHTKLCHGDFNPSNIIIKEDGSYYIIDWAHATQGNGAADAARSYLLFRLAGDNVTADKYLDLFCEKSRTPKQYVQKWMRVVAASQSVKGNEEERQFLMSWVDVVDYE